VDYTGQAFHRVNFLTGQAESTEKEGKILSIKSGKNDAKAH